MGIWSLRDREENETIPHRALSAINPLIPKRSRRICGGLVSDGVCARVGGVCVGWGGGGGLPLRK